MQFPRSFGRYTLQRLEGEGGFGQVFEATVPGPMGSTRLVALKVLQDQGQVLVREARLGGLLRHQHLVDVYEVGEFNNRWYCAMEWCDGGTLAEYVPLSPRATVEAALQICSALDYAHRELGLVHQDLKPSNFLVHQGQVKVGDLGIAVANNTPTSAGVGTRGFMAPEQIRGAKVDARTDIYALGATMVTLLGCGMAKPEATFNLFFEPEYEAITADYPRWIKPIIDRCIASHPEDRYRTMADLAQALENLEVSGLSLADTVGYRPSQKAQNKRTNLTYLPDHFIGREEELSWLSRRLKTAGTYLITGPPGIGKTRLAEAASLAWLTTKKTKRRSAWSIDVGPLQSEDEVIYTIARTIRVPLHGSSDQHRQQVANALSSRGPVVVILDSVEHLNLDPLLKFWRKNCHSARFILTSRRVSPRYEVLKLAPLSEKSATELVISRASERGVTLMERDELKKLIHRLDGVPLALELAAGRLGVLSLHDLLDHLSMTFLRKSEQDKHQTLEHSIASSWVSLSEELQEILSQLSVFVGGFTESAAHAVTAGELGHSLEQLVQHSLVRKKGARYHLLSPIHAYARKQLKNPDHIKERHGLFYSRLNPIALRLLVGPDDQSARRIITPEYDNILIACKRAIKHVHAEIAVLTVDSLCAIALVQGQLSSITLLPKILALPLTNTLRVKARTIALILMKYTKMEFEPDKELDLAKVDALTRGRYRLRYVGHQQKQAGFQAMAKLALADMKESKNLGFEQFALLYCGGCAVDAQKHEEASSFTAQGIALGAHNQCYRTEGLLLTQAAKIAFQIRENTTAIRALRRAKRAFMLCDDRLGLNATLSGLGVTQQHSGQLVAARQTLQEGIALSKEIGVSFFMPLLVINLAELDDREGDLLSAERGYRRGAKLAEQANRRRLIPVALCSVAATLHEQGKLEEAREEAASGLKLARELGDGYTVLSGLLVLTLMELEIGDLERARLAAEMALEVGLDTQPMLLGLAHAGMCRVYNAQKKRAKAEEQLAEAVARVGRDQGEATAWLLLTEADFYREVDPLRAENLLRQALPLCATGRVFRAAKWVNKQLPPELQVGGYDELLGAL